MDRHTNPAIAIANDVVKTYLNADVCFEPGITSAADVYRFACARLGIETNKLPAGVTPENAFLVWRSKMKDYAAAHAPLHGVEPHQRGWKT